MCAKNDFFKQVELLRKEVIIFVNFVFFLVVFIFKFVLLVFIVDHFIFQRHLENKPHYENYDTY